MFTFFFCNFSFAEIPDCIFFFVQEYIKTCSETVLFTPCHCGGRNIKQHDTVKLDLWSGTSGRCSVSEKLCTCTVIHTHMHTHAHMHNTFQLIETCPSNHTSKTTQPSREKHDTHSLQCPCQDLGRAWHTLLKTSASISVGRLYDNVPPVSMTVWVYYPGVGTCCQPNWFIVISWYNFPSK